MEQKLQALVGSRRKREKVKLTKSQGQLAKNQSDRVAAAATAAYHGGCNEPTKQERTVEQAGGALVSEVQLRKLLDDVKQDLLSEVKQLLTTAHLGAMEGSRLPRDGRDGPDSRPRDREMSPPPLPLKR